MTLKKFLYLSLFQVVLLSACSQDEYQKTTISIADISGLWDSSESHQAEQDLIYTNISHNGDILEYDFDGDAVDKGLNCYQVESGSIKALGDNRFLVTADMHQSQTLVLALTLLEQGNLLKVELVTDKTSNQATRLPKVQHWKRVKNPQLLAHEPSCTSTATNAVGEK